jgi:hypothetical protein
MGPVKTSLCQLLKKSPLSLVSPLSFRNNVASPSDQASDSRHSPVSPWPLWLIKLFVIANQPQLVTDETVFYGPYCRLLYHLLGLDGQFEIHSQYRLVSTLNKVDLAAVFTFGLKKHPVLYIEVKPPNKFFYPFARMATDRQMRNRFQPALCGDLVTPRVPGISAFGTRMAFYEYATTTGTITPDRGSRFKVAPAERWMYDFLEANGIAKLRQVTEDVRAMCHALKK